MVAALAAEPMTKLRLSTRDLPRDRIVPPKGGWPVVLGRDARSRVSPGQPKVSAANRSLFVMSVDQSMIATARVQPAEAARILTGKQLTVKPLDGSASRLCS